MEKSILIVEDEKAILDILSFNLKREGYRTIEAQDGEEGLALARAERPDLILLDIMLPKLDGFSVCKTLRDEDSMVPVIMLTAREGESDKITGLEIGADDYITKPFSMRELLARVRANMRRTGGMAGRSKSAKRLSGGLELDEEAADVRKDGVSLGLTQREFELIRFLAFSPGKAFSREELMERVWNFDYYGDLRTVDVTIRRLREKIEDNPAEPRHIITRRGVGYLFHGEE